MKIQRTIPPAAAPLDWKDMASGLLGSVRGKRGLRRLEQELKEYFNVEHVFPVSSGKAALTIILKALQTLLPYKREVLVPAYTCFSVPSAIVKAGLRIAACDIARSSFDFDYDLLQKELNRYTLCVVSTHLFGLPADTDRVKSLCQPRRIFVVEDAAQAMGGRRQERKLGTIGDVGFFSLGRGKNITCGSGGIIVTNDKRIGQAIAIQYAGLESPGVLENIKEFMQLLAMKVLMHPGLYWVPAGMPSLGLGETIFHKDFPIKRMSGMKAGLLKRWESSLMRTNRIRRATTAFFKTELAVNTPESEVHPCLRLPMLAKNRSDRNKIYLRGKTQGLSLMYPSPVNEIAEIKGHFHGMEYPVAKDIAGRLFALPTHPLLTERDRMAIVRAVNDHNQSGTTKRPVVAEGREG